MWLAEAQVEDIESHFGNLIFMMCFVLVAIAAGIWWLKRNS